MCKAVTISVRFKYSLRRIEVSKSQAIDASCRRYSHDPTTRKSESVYYCRYHQQYYTLTIKLTVPITIYGCSPKKRDPKIDARTLESF